MNDNSDNNPVATGRERVLRALSYKQLNRVPVDLGGTFGMGAHVSVIANLRQVLGLDEPRANRKLQDSHRS